MDPIRAVDEGRDEDMLIITAWVKKELFNQVKFLYQPDDDLAVGGYIYRKFLLDCKDRLVGLKIREREPSESRRRYCESLWNHATRKKANLVTKGINARHSSIYSSTLNRFNGKSMTFVEAQQSCDANFVSSLFTDLCDQCSEENLIFPSLEAFECGIACPVVHVMFYDWFLKSSVGDSAWKQAIYNPKDPLEPMAPIQGEAFAMILLKNNYFAWLSEAKLRLKDQLVTEYDTKKEKQGKVEDAGLYFLRQCHLNLDVDMEHFSGNTPAIPEIDKIVVKPNGRYPDIYKEVSLDHMLQMKRVAGLVLKNTKYKEMKKGLQEMTNIKKRQHVEAEQDSSDDEEEEPQGEGASPQRRTRRKLLKSFREYTTSNDKEGRFKGWSVRAGKDMAEYIEKWTAPEFLARRQLFWMAYRESYKRKQDALGKKKKPSGAQVNPPNYQTKVWGFEDIPDEVVNI